MHWCEIPELVPYWAITKHAHICEISKQPEKFLSGPGIIPARKEMLERIARGEKNAFDSMQTIITMDGPKHREYRKVASPWFTPHAVDPSRRGGAGERAAPRRPALRRAGERRRALRLRRPRSPCKHPLRILCTILGVPEEDEEHDPPPHPAALRGRGSGVQALRGGPPGGVQEPRHGVRAVLRQDHRRPPREADRRPRVACSRTRR